MAEDLTSTSIEKIRQAIQIVNAGADSAFARLKAAELDLVEAGVGVEFDLAEDPWLNPDGAEFVLALRNVNGWHIGVVNNEVFTPLDGIRRMDRVEAGERLGIFIERLYQAIAADSARTVTPFLEGQGTKVPRLYRVAALPPGVHRRPVPIEKYRGYDEQPWHESEAEAEKDKQQLAESWDKEKIKLIVEQQPAHLCRKCQMVLPACEAFHAGDVDLRKPAGPICRSCWEEG